MRHAKDCTSTPESDGGLQRQARRIQAKYGLTKYVIDDELAEQIRVEEARKEELLAEHAQLDAAIEAERAESRAKLEHADAIVAYAKVKNEKIAALQSRVAELENLFGEDGQTLDPDNVQSRLIDADALEYEVRGLGGLDHVKSRLADADALQAQLFELGGMDHVRKRMREYDVMEAQLRHLGGIAGVQSKLNEANTLQQTVEGLGGASAVQKAISDGKSAEQQVKDMCDVDQGLATADGRNRLRDELKTARRRDAVIQTLGGWDDLDATLPKAERAVSNVAELEGTLADLYNHVIRHCKEVEQAAGMDDQGSNALIKARDDLDFDPLEYYVYSVLSIPNQMRVRRDEVYDAWQNTSKQPETALQRLQQVMNNRTWHYTVLKSIYDARLQDPGYQATAAAESADAESSETSGKALVPYKGSK